MLTIKKFEQLQNINSMLCLSCKDYYGTRENNYLCSKCINKENVKNKDNNFYKQYILSKKNFDIFPNIIVKQIIKLLNNIYLINLLDENVSTHGEYVFNIIQNFRNIINENSKIYINYMFSDEQAFEIISKIRWNDFNKGYLISHAIIRNRILPWSDYKQEYYDNSSFCYFGNFSELPDNEIHFDKILNYNLNKNFINNF
tara:strand:+ start:42 stop:641 length:600 start_codon:yes stop_codon:yes gene_type:complete